MKLNISIVFFIILFPLAAVAQTANSLTINPTNGTSTLDQLNPTKSDSVEYEFPSGFRCKIGGGDTPSLVFYGDGGKLATIDNSGLTGNRYGVAFVLPLYQRKHKSCDEPMKLYNVLNKLEIAEKMVTTGAMTNEEYLKLSKRLKKEIFGIE
jgi:hypothetical protein